MGKHIEQSKHNNLKTWRDYSVPVSSSSSGSLVLAGWY